MDEISKCCTCGFEWRTGQDGSHSCSATMAKTMQKAIDLGTEYGGIDGAHHKAWVIDQMIRILAGDQYDEVIAKACDGSEGPNTYYWDHGIAP